MGNVTKRIISLILAAVALLGLWVPVYAEEEPSDTPKETAPADTVEDPDPVQSEPPADVPEKDTGEDGGDKSDDSGGTQQPTTPPASDPDNTTAPDNTNTPAGPGEDVDDGSEDKDELPDDEDGDDETDDGEEDVADIALLSVEGAYKAQVNGRWYCFDPAGNKLMGWQIIDGQKYFFRRKDGSGVMLTGWVSITGTDKVTRKYYFDPATGMMLTGRQKIGKYTYFLRMDDLESELAGAKQTGLVTLTEGGAQNTYFFRRKDGSGKMLTGWVDISGRGRCYFDPATGIMKTGWLTVGKNKYYLDPATGVRKTGILTLEEGGEQHTYFLRRKDGSGKMLTGWVNISGRGNCYFDPATGIMQTGWLTVGKNRYYLDLTTGVRKTGILTLEEDGKENTYFLRRKDGSGKMLTGWVDISGRGKCYFDPATGIMQTGWLTVGKNRYYLDLTTGVRKTGILTLEEDGKKNIYFLRRKDGSGKMLTGWVDISGRGKCYFDPATGIMQTGWLTVGSNRYYLDPTTGVRKTGLVELEENGEKHTYFLRRKDGSGRMLTGWVDISGKGKCYFDPATGWQLKGKQVIGGKTYYLDPTTGVLPTGWKTIDGKKYYFSKSTGEMLIGFQTISGSKYYFEEGDLSNPNLGVMATGWRILNGSKYHFDDSNGKMATGLKAVGSSKYYFTSAGVMQTGWQTISGKKYYFEPGDLNSTATGVMATGKKIIDGETYYFGSSGAMATGVTYMNDDMYYFTSDGKLVTNQDVSLAGKTYHVNENGIITGYMTDPMRKAVKVLNSVGWNLRAAFNWSAGLRYSNRWMRASSTPHSSWYANYGFNNKTGNCYVMAATFYQMAKVLGYEVRFVEGYVRSTPTYNAPHGWTEVKINGRWYVFDTNFTNETGRNGYQISYGQSGTWMYVNYKYVA